MLVWLLRGDNVVLFISQQDYINYIIIWLVVWNSRGLNTFQWCGRPSLNVEVSLTTVSHGPLMDVGFVDSGSPLTLVAKVDVFDC